MTEVILVASGVVFGALCFGAGYLIAHKKKMEAQAQAEFERVKAMVEMIVGKIKEKV